MTTPPQRRRDPQPISRGWELAAAAVGGAVIAVALAALAGLGLASALWGEGWVWPHGTETVIHVLGGNDLAPCAPGRGGPGGLVGGVGFHEDRQHLSVAYRPRYDVVAVTVHDMLLKRNVLVSPGHLERVDGAPSYPV